MPHLDAQALPSSESIAPSWSLTKVFIGPNMRNQVCVMHSRITSVVRLATISHMLKRTHTQMTCTITLRFQNNKSNCTFLLNSTAMSTEATGLLPGRDQARQAGHVSTTRAISSSARAGTPALVKRSLSL